MKITYKYSIVYTLSRHIFPKVLPEMNKILFKILYAVYVHYSPGVKPKHNGDNPIAVSQVSTLKCAGFQTMLFFELSVLCT